MNDEKIKAFIRQHSELFWYIPEDKKEDISPEVLLENILNYGDMESVRQLFKLIGVEEAAAIFNRITHKSERRKGNMHEITLHFFQEFFNRYAHRYS